jgi:hypothetical protein
MRTRIWVVLLACASLGVAQDQSQTTEVLKRLDRLEAQNRELMEEIRSLRKQLAATAPAAEPAPAAAAPVEEKLAVQQTMIGDLEQTKVGTEHRFPVSLTGMALFNAFLNGGNSGDQMNPVGASVAPSLSNGGATMRQSILGFRFNGPGLPGGGKASGQVLFDFYAGTGTSLNQLVRLRVANIDLAWKNTTFTVAQDKPILAPRDPDSLAQVGVSPLTGAGNLWLWQPQVRVEQRFVLGEQSGINAQVGVYQTNEAGAGVSNEYVGLVPRARPGYQGRFLFWTQRDGRRFEVAPGFHYSDSHLLGQSVPSRVFSVDWLFQPLQRIDFSGQFFHGENVGVIGGLQQGISIYEYQAHAVQATGGWAQLTFHATPRLWFNIYGGQEDDRNSDLVGNAIGKNQAYAANVMFRLSSNLLTSFEYSRVRTTYLQSGNRTNPHYDLALAYLF